MTGPGRGVSESAGKPSSVPRFSRQSRRAVGRQSSVSVAGCPATLATLPEDRPSQPYRPPIRSCSGWGLPSQPVSRLLVGSYPHHFTFAVAYAAAVSFLWHSPSGYPYRALPGTLLCGARTFLDGTIPARLPGGLDRYCTRGVGGNTPTDKGGGHDHEECGHQERDRQTDVDQRAGDRGADRLSSPVQTHRDGEGATVPGGIGPPLAHGEHSDVEGPIRQPRDQQGRRGQPGIAGEGKEREGGAGDHVGDDHDASLPALAIHPAGDERGRHRSEALDGPQSAPQ